MSRRLFLHIGTMKSATTYIQSFCDANASALRERGLLWLGAAANSSAVFDLYGTGQPDDFGARRMRWSTFVDRVEAHDGDVLLSNEFLSLRTSAKIQLLFESLPDADPHVVVTARDVARAATSQWQERVRHRAMGTWDEFMAHLTAPESRRDPDVAWFWRRQNLTRLVREWTAKVGVDRLTVVTVPPAGSPPTEIRDRFFSVVGLTDLAELVDPAGHNPSMGAFSAELMRRVHERLDDEERDELHLVLKHILARRVLASRASAEPALVLSTDQLAWARDQARQTIDALIASGVRVVGTLEDLMPTVVFGPESGPVEPSDGDLLNAAIDALIGVSRAADELARDLGGDRYQDVVRASGRQRRASADG
jgi:hypothetical protein